VLSSTGKVDATTQGKKFKPSVILLDRGLQGQASGDFMRTIRAVANGEKVLPGEMTDTLFSQIVDQVANGTNPSRIVKSIRMTKREREVIVLIAEGMSNKEIAQKLHISAYTVKSHVHNIHEKLALHSRVQIVNYAHAYDTSLNYFNLSGGSILSGKTQSITL